MFATLLKTRKGETQLRDLDEPLTDQRKNLESLFVSGSDEFAGGCLVRIERDRAWLEFPKPKGKTVKKLSTLLFAAVVLLAFASSTFAAAHTYETVLAANAATIEATAGTNVAKVIDCRNQGSSVMFQIESMADASGAYVLTIPFQRSVDGSVYAGMQADSVAISFNGVTKQTITTNIPTYGALWMKIPHLTNATASINVTNFVLKRAIHRDRGW